MELKTRRIFVVIVVLIGVAVLLFLNPGSYEQIFTKITGTEADSGSESSAEAIVKDSTATSLAIDILAKLEVKGRAPKKGYTREQFYDGWPLVDNCSLRQKILKRDFGNSAVTKECDVVSGEFDEPYTGEHRVFTKKSEIAELQIDHVVALSDAWQKGAQEKSVEVRYQIATDPLNLLAVDGQANQDKSDGDAATWLPPNKKFRCQYVARQISVKYKYGLWVAKAEKEAMERILQNCPTEPAIGV